MHLADETELIEDRRQHPWTLCAENFMSSVAMNGTNFNVNSGTNSHLQYVKSGTRNGTNLKKKLSIFLNIATPDELFTVVARSKQMLKVYENVVNYIQPQPQPPRPLPRSVLPLRHPLVSRGHGPVFS